MKKFITPRMEIIMMKNDVVTASGVPAEPHQVNSFIKDTDKIVTGTLDASIIFG